MSTPSPIERAVLAADWKLLRWQKSSLVGLASRLESEGTADYEVLDGVIAYLDSIMDAAAEVVGASTVFGTLEPGDALAQVHALLDATTWSADTLDAIADVVRSAGFEIRPPESAS